MINHSNILLWVFLHLSFLASSQKWELVSVPSNQDLKSLCFYTENEGYVAGDSGTVYFTENGGQDWTLIPTPNEESIEQIILIDDTLYIGEYRGEILKRQINDTIWESLLGNLHKWNRNAYGFHVLNKDIMHTYGIEYTTRRSQYSLDRGKTWTIYQLNGGIIQDAYAGNETNGNIYFLGQIALNIIHSQTREQSTTSLLHHQMVSVTGTSQKIWMIGNQDEGVAIYSKSFGGITWNIQTIPTTSEMKRIRFLNDELGFMIGDTGTILQRTVDGDWLSQCSPTKENLYEMQVIGNDIYVVGDHGTVIRRNSSYTKYGEISIQENETPCKRDTVNLVAENVDLPHWVDLETKDTLGHDVSLQFITEETKSYLLLDGACELDTVTLNVQDCPVHLMVSQLITPNGDGKNDTWQISNIEYLNNYQIYVYDQWGIEVFHSINYENDWGGENLPKGVYVYLIHDHEFEEVYTGNLVVK